MVITLRPRRNSRCLHRSVWTRSSQRRGFCHTYSIEKLCSPNVLLLSIWRWSGSSLKEDIAACTAAMLTTTLDEGSIQGVDKAVHGAVPFSLPCHQVTGLFQDGFEHCESASKYQRMQEPPEIKSSRRDSQRSQQDHWSPFYEGIVSADQDTGRPFQSVQIEEMQKVWSVNVVNVYELTVETNNIPE